MSGVDQIKLNASKQYWAAGVLLEQSLLVMSSLSPVSETDREHDFLKVKWCHE